MPTKPQSGAHEERAQELGSSSLKSHHLISLGCMYLSQTFTSQFAASPERRGRRNTREERANHSRLALWAPNHSLTIE